MYEARPLRRNVCNDNTPSPDNRLLDQQPPQGTLESEVGKFPNTATYIKSTVFLALGLAILSLAAGISIASIDVTHLALILETNETVVDIAQLVGSLLITFCSDGLGYVHSVSLRWALYRENRLEYNTNFRLFTSAKSSLANRWYMNLLSAVSLVFCYAGVSVGLMRTEQVENKDFALSSVGFFALSLGISGQLLTAVLCLRHHEKLILSWNSNPLWNTLVATRLGTVHHRAGRCMQSVFDGDLKPGPRRPAIRKQFLWHLRSTRWIVLFVWILCGVTIGSATAVIHIPPLTHPRGHENFVFNWSDWSYSRNPSLNFGADVIPIGVQSLFSFLFLFIVQGMQALGFHCVELLVNMNRDEQTWRKCGRRCGSLPSASGPLVAALSSWQTMTLTVLKTILHWTIGQAMIPRVTIIPGVLIGLPASEAGVLDFSFDFQSSRLLIFAVMSFVVAVFTTVLAFWPVKGLQPAAWGHLQTLANLVDSWGEPGRTLWWGDKGVGEDGIRHAGTTDVQESVGMVDPSSWYAGKSGDQIEAYEYIS